MSLSKLDVVLYLEGKEPRCFEGCERSLLEIKSFFLHTLLFGVWFCHIFLVFPFLLYLIIVILVLEFLFDK